MRKLRAADLFCGAGGTTIGAVQSGYADVVLAVNHWRVAVRTHQENHPDTRHLCAEIDMVDPRDFLDMGIDIVFASPECIFHSNARGGKPVDDQKRATAWCVPRWAEVLRPKWLVIENVREFKDWGPLTEKRDGNGRIVKHKGQTAWVPDKSRKGEIFNAWIAAIKGIGYHVEWKILNAADYGGATKRMRLFVVARYGKSTKPIPWPAPTHTPDRYRTARTDVIDWSLPSRSIFDRPKMLSEKTLRRIEIGLRKFNGGRVPYLVDRNWQENRQGRNRVHAVDQPLGTVTTQGGQGLAEPFMLPRQGVFDCRQDKPAASIDQPLNTITASHSPAALVQPVGAEFILKAAGSGYNDPTFTGVSSADAPLPTMTTQVHHALVEPQGFLVKYHGGKDPNRDGTERAVGVDQPMPTLDTQPRFALAEPQGFVMDLAHANDGSGRAQSVDQPLGTVTTKHTHTLVEPFQLETTGRGAGRVRSIDAPVNTIIAARNTQGVVQPQPFVAHIAGPGSSKVDESSIASVDEPMRTILTREDRGLVQPQAFMFDTNHGDDERTGDRVKSLDEPLGTVTTVRGQALAEPQAFLTKYHGTSGAQSVDEPLGTVDGNDRHALALPVTATITWFRNHIAALRAKYPNSKAMQSLLNTMEELGVYDVLYRMLVNKELARAQGFPDDYLLFGTSSEVTKQIGNSVHTLVARAITAAIGESEQPRKRKASA